MESTLYLLIKSVNGHVSIARHISDFCDYLLPDRNIKLSSI